MSGAGSEHGLVIIIIIIIRAVIIYIYLISFISTYTACIIWPAKLTSHAAYREISMTVAMAR